MVSNFKVTNFSAFDALLNESFFSPLDKEPNWMGGASLQVCQRRGKHL